MDHLVWGEWYTAKSVGGLLGASDWEVTASMEITIKSQKLWRFQISRDGNAIRVRHSHHVADPAGAAWISHMTLPKPHTLTAEPEPKVFKRLRRTQLGAAPPLRPRGSVGSEVASRSVARRPRLGL